jgi:uncharacterized OB-fold protein
MRSHDKVLGWPRPAPRIDNLIKPFWDNAKREQLSVQRCTTCGDMHFPPSPSCPQCLGTAQDWTVVSGRAELLSWVEFHQAYWEAVKQAVPYRVCLVRLDEGPLLVTNVVGLEGEPVIGSRLEATFADMGDGLKLPVFQPHYGS